MGMDVHGVKSNEYFRNNVWWWRPLAQYVCEVAPEITSNCQYWQTNDGDGLTEEESIALADALQAEVDAGRTAEYQAKHEAHLESIPRESCEICDGTGFRKQPPQVGAGDRLCNGCNGEGERESFATHYPFSVDNVVEFIGFLRKCGGFQIF